VQTIRKSRAKFGVVIIWLIAAYTIAPIPHCIEPFPPVPRFCIRHYVDLAFKAESGIIAMLRANYSIVKAPIPE
jgi:hypothetical protein